MFIPANKIEKIQYQSKKDIFFYSKTIFLAQKQSQQIKQKLAFLGFFLIQILVKLF